ARAPAPGPLAGLPFRAPDPRLGARGLDAPHRLWGVDGQGPGMALDSQGGPLVLGHPAGRPDLVARTRLDRVLHPDPQHPLVHDPRVDSLEPVVEPPDALLEEPDARSREGIVRKRMRPRPDEPFPRHGKTFEQTRHGVRVAVDESADRVDGTLDRTVVLADRAGLPVGGAP